MEGPSHIPKFLISYLTSHLISPMSQFRFHLSPFTYLKVGNSMKHRLWPQELQQALSIAAPPAGLSRMRTLSILQHPGLGNKTPGESRDFWWLASELRFGGWKAAWQSVGIGPEDHISVAPWSKFLRPGQVGLRTGLRTMYSDEDVTCVLFCFNRIMVL